MPPVSQAQARFMRAVASGSIKKAGLPPAKAAEFVKGTPTKNLPQHTTGHGALDNAISGYVNRTHKKKKHVKGKKYDPAMFKKKGK